MLNEWFQSLADYLGQQEWYQKMDTIDVSLLLSMFCLTKTSKIDNYKDVLLNEEHQVVHRYKGFFSDRGYRY